RHGGRVCRPRPGRQGPRATGRAPLVRVGRERAARAVPPRRARSLPAGLGAVRCVRRPLRPGGDPMRTLIIAFTIALFAVRPGGAGGGNFWASSNAAPAQPNQSLPRDGAQTYSNTAAYEGYQWGGGCWNNNDVDEGGGAPPQDVNTHGEGADCSGLVFKTWKE